MSDRNFFGLIVVGGILSLAFSVALFVIVLHFVLKFW